MGDVRETFEEVEGCTIEKESRQDQLKGQVTEVLSANVIAMLVVLNTIVDNTTVGKLTEKDDNSVRDEEGQVKNENSENWKQNN